ncbi:MAG: methyltransferase domain-containing protein, partial [Gemmatimonadetes bacterium]|nr:methyltransferase domain-containing protein [Gemmatimonadota bacterium]
MLYNDRFPRSVRYDQAWALDHSMGPNVLWLAEWLAEGMSLKPGMRVLDLGCGKALSSIFLAKEFDLEVWATDLWIGATENLGRITEAGAERVYPVHADAHSLPFADGFFDAAVSLDAYHYFGTDDLYIERFSRLVKTGGQLGIVSPGTQYELDGDVPAHLQPYWVWDFCSFHSPAWWKQHWEKSGQVDVQCADFLADGWRHW